MGKALAHFSFESHQPWKYLPQLSRLIEIRLFGKQRHSEANVYRIRMTQYIFNSSANRNTANIYF